MKTIRISLFLLFPTVVFAQTLVGNYFITTANGEITMSLESHNNQSYTGMLVGHEGSKYAIKAELDDQGGILGTISGSEDESGFAAYPYEQTLYVVLMPVGADGEPNVSQAQKFPMTRRESVTGDILSAGGPLINSSNTNSWTGTYYGDVNGTATNLTLNHQGNAIQGKIDAEGYIYNIAGNLENNMLEGVLTDPQTQGKMLCSGSMENGVILLTMSDESTGQSFQLTYSKKDPGQNNTTNSKIENASAVNENVERDPNLVGNWIYSNSYTSGSFSFASQVRFIVNPDGTYLYGDSKMAGGGAASSVQSEGGDWERGQWKTENKNIYTNVGSGWELYTGYLSRATRC